MSILTLDAARDVPGLSSAPVESTPVAAPFSIEIVQRNMTVDEVPDQRYWTAYDSYMIKREARAMRAAHMHALIGKSWRALTRRLLG